MKKICIIGLGYVGLPLAVQAASKGYEVCGIDLNESLVEKVNARQSPYTNDDRFDQALKAVEPELLTATTAFDACADSAVVIICVPTPTIDNVPDLQYVQAAARQAAKYLHVGQLIVLESTVNPGVTRENVLSILESESGLVVGRDFYLAHCPERIDPGNVTYHVGNINRVVGGITKACTDKAALFYTEIIDASIVPLASAEEAEFVKSWENTHRNAMIALANSAAIICDSLGMDIDNIMMGMQSKVGQFGLSLARPGIGPGGHCIPEDIHYVIKKAKEHGVDTSFLEKSAALNDAMPHYAIDGLERSVKENNDDLSQLRVGLLGLAYKPNVADSRRSPAVVAGKQLVPKVKELFVHDPHVTAADLIPGSSRLDSLNSLLENVDAIFVATGHDEYVASLTANTLSDKGIRYVLDGRNILNKHQIEQAGISYKGIGK